MFAAFADQISSEYYTLFGNNTGRRLLINEGRQHRLLNHMPGLRTLLCWINFTVGQLQLWGGMDRRIGTALWSYYSQKNPEIVRASLGEHLDYCYEPYQPTYDFFMLDRYHPVFYRWIVRGNLLPFGFDTALLDFTCLGQYPLLWYLPAPRLSVRPTATNNLVLLIYYRLTDQNLDKFTSFPTNQPTTCFRNAE